MKMKSLIAAIFLLGALPSAAQNEVGKFTVKPFAGVNISTISGYEYDVFTSKTGFTGGVEAEYGATPWLGVSLGAVYSQQGAKCKGPMSFTAYNKQTGYTANFDVRVDGKLKADYINLPLMANFYVFKGLALKTGVQVGFPINDKLNFKTEYFATSTFPVKDFDVSPMNPNEYIKIGIVSGNQTDVCKSIDVGIPIGVSYEYKKIVLDARYYFGLTNSYDLESPEGIEFGIIKHNGTGSSEKMRNRYFSVTLGYKL